MRGSIDGVGVDAEEGEGEGVEVMTRRSILLYSFRNYNEIQ